MHHMTFNPHSTLNSNVIDHLNGNNNNSGNNQVTFITTLNSNQLPLHPTMTCNSTNTSCPTCLNNNNNNNNIMDCLNWCKSPLSSTQNNPSFNVYNHNHNNNNNNPIFPLSITNVPTSTSCTQCCSCCNTISKPSYYYDAQLNFASPITEMKHDSSHLYSISNVPFKANHYGCNFNINYNPTNIQHEQLFKYNNNCNYFQNGMNFISNTGYGNQIKDDSFTNCNIIPMNNNIPSNTAISLPQIPLTTIPQSLTNISTTMLNNTSGSDMSHINNNNNNNNASGIINTNTNTNITNGINDPDAILPPLIEEDTKDIKENKLINDNNDNNNEKNQNDEMIEKINIENSWKSYRELNGSYTCPDCKCKIKHWRSFRAHMSKHRYPVQCTLCEEWFDQQYLTIHIQYKHSDCYRYKCRYCDKSYKYRAGINKHVKNNHKDKCREKKK